MSNPSRRLSADILKANRNAFIALKTLPDYAPLNKNYSTEQLVSLVATMEEAQQSEIRAQHALAAARDAAAAAELAVHNAILGVKAQVIAQYGADSDQVQALGLKKKSERKRPVRRKAA